jgi:Lrp/AsnC family transcriptional regulator
MRDLIEIDSIDRQILRLLQTDVTQSVQQIAEKVGLTNNPCWRRIRRLEESGVIKKRVAVVDPAKVGLGTTAFVMIKTDRHTADWLSNFKQRIQEIPEIVECHRMTGAVDYLLKVLVKDLTHYDYVYQKLISAIPDLSDVSSTFSMENLKQHTIVDTSTAIRGSR